MIIVLSAPLLIYLSVKQHTRSKEVYTQLTRDGYSIVFSGTGNSYIAFNVKNACFRVGSLINYGYFQESISYIHNYEWKWKELDGKKIENNLEYIRGVKILRTLCNRLILKISNASEYYFDYYSLGSEKSYHLRLLEDGIKDD